MSNLVDDLFDVCHTRMPENWASSTPIMSACV